MEEAEGMNAGKLRHRIAIQGKTITTDAGGGRVEAWADGPQVWASVEPLEGRERLEAMQTDASATHRVRMRYLPGVTARNRVRFGDRTLEIVAVIDPDERHDELRLLCTEAGR